MKMPRIALALLYFIVATSYVSARIEVLFSPDDKPTVKLIECIKNSRYRIYAAVYMLTDKVIAEALIDAKIKRNVDVQIIIDKISHESLFGKGKMLQEKRVPIFIFDPPKTSSATRAWGAGPIMHNKFALFDNILWTGSFNWTVSANRANQENVLITDDYTALKRYEARFEYLKKLCPPKTTTLRSSSKRSSTIDTFLHGWKKIIHQNSIA